jgi:hypothetical protein
VLPGLVLHPGLVLLGQVHLGLVTCVSIGRILQGSDGARGARGTPGAWRARTGLVLHPGRVLLGQVHLGLVTCVSIGRILQGSDGARGAQGTPGAWRARAAPGSTERVTTERVCGKEGHDCEWQCGKVLILCLSLKSSLWRGSGVYQPPSATKHPGRRGRRCRHASAYAGQGAGHMGAGDVSCGGWGGGRVTCAASMPPSPTPPRGRISSTSERSEPQIWR